MRRQIGFVLIVLVALLSIVGIGGFSTAETDRGVTVAVVNDDEAYLGYDEPDDTIEVNGTDTVTLVEVTNRFSYSLTTVETIIKAGDSVSVDADDNVGPVGSGDTVEIRGEVECLKQTTTTVNVSVTASGDKIDAFLDGGTQYRQLEIKCT